MHGREVGDRIPVWKSRGRQEVLGWAACDQQGLETCRNGAKGPEEALGGKHVLCVRGSFSPLLPRHNYCLGRNDGLQLQGMQAGEWDPV